jgi:hypothetical protein
MWTHLDRAALAWIAISERSIRNCTHGFRVDGSSGYHVDLIFREIAGLHASQYSVVFIHAFLLSFLGL